MKSLKRIAPIFAVRDLDAAIAHYKRLGFSTRTYEGGGSAFATVTASKSILAWYPPQTSGQGRRTFLLTMQTDLRRSG